MPGGGLENEFDPYRQVASRLKALHDVGHPTEKIELLILGGKLVGLSERLPGMVFKTLF